MGVKNFRLDDFAVSYVSAAFEEAVKSPELQKFDENVRSRVSSEMGLPIDLIERLHNPFHWAMFQEDQDSPVELLQGVKPGEGFSVRAKRAYTDEDIAYLVDYVLDKYGSHLKDRIPGGPVYASSPAPTA